MANSLNVFGGAKVAADGATLGYTVDGVEISFNIFYKDVFVDLWGPMVPYDRQYFLQTATITCDMVYYDPTVLESLVPGTCSAPGLLIQAQGYAFSVVITAGTGTGTGPASYTFPTCIVDPSCVSKLGTLVTTSKIVFIAYPAQTSGGAGAVLFH